MDENEAPISDDAAAAARVALLGFALGQAAGPRAAQAYTSSSAALVVTALYTSTTTALGVTIVGGIILTVKVVSDDDDTAMRGPGSRTRALVDAGLLASETDLSLQIGLLAESPTAWHRVNQEVDAGGGPTVDALARATGLDPVAVCAAWRAGAPAQEVRSAAEAEAAIRAFLEAAAPRMELAADVEAEWAWRLVREAQLGDAPGTGTALLAEWLGVPAEAVARAAARATPAGADGDLRTRVHADPDAFLDAFSAALEQEQGPAVEATIARLTAAAQAPAVAVAGG